MQIYIKIQEEDCVANVCNKNFVPDQCSQSSDGKIREWNVMNLVHSNFKGSEFDAGQL